MASMLCTASALVKGGDGCECDAVAWPAAVVLFVVLVVASVAVEEDETRAPGAMGSTSGCSTSTTIVDQSSASAEAALL